MGTLAPAVVAVVVAHDPGAWFEETLASFAVQDYPELSVLVLDVGSREDLAARVAAILPAAYVRRFEGNRAFGSSVNEVQTMVEGADYFLLCHDDVALFPDTIQLMVEEGFRSNAGIVSPKVVSWDDPERLVHVGMTVDKGGSVVDRVQPHEIDHGQHDAVRDVFVAPGGSTLVRADLFAELGGYDTGIVAMGEDLDLCWRAQVAGARVIVAPDARVRHLEELAAGSRPIDQELATSRPGRRSHPVTLQELQRRHELWAVLKCYGRFHLLRVVPQVFVLAVGEVVVAELGGNRARARAVLRAWRWNLGRLSELRRQRRELRRHRRLSDHEIRALQVGGSTRLATYSRRVVQHGIRGADTGAGPQDGAAALALASGPDGNGSSAASASGSDGGGTEPSERGRVSGAVQLLAWLAAALVVLVGTRGIIGGRLPVVGQFVPFPTWTSTLAQFAHGWQPSGVGTTAPASPALALSGLVGTVLLGAMGTTQKVLVFGCLPFGVWGVVRLVRSFRSQRAALVAGLAYLAMALAYDDIALGRWGALVVYAGTPWVLTALFRATATSPFTSPFASPVAGSVRPAEEGRPEEPVSRLKRLGEWGARHRVVRAVAGLGLLEAVLVAFVPSVLVVLALAVLALVLATALQGDRRAGLRALTLAVASSLVAGLVLLPYAVGVLAAGRGWVAVFGVPVPGSGAASWGSLLRFAVGPIGGSVLAWGFPLAAAVPLVLARGERSTWAVRLWSVALVSWLAAWVIGRGWTGSLAVDPHVLLAPAAVAVSAAIGLGVAAFEEDLHDVEFGWRQLVTVVAAVAVVLGTIPTLISALPGRWDLPDTDFAQSVAWMGAKSSTGAFRVLWLGDVRALNQSGWAAGDGLAYATSGNGSPDARWLWSAPGPGPASDLSAAVDLARRGGTDQLGRLLAPAGVRYVAVVTSLAPEIPGEQTPTAYPVPADLTPALNRQLDLSTALSGSGITVYANADWVPQRAQLVPRLAPTVPTPRRPEVLGSAVGTGILSPVHPVLLGPPTATSYRGPVRAGTVFSAAAPAGRWLLSGPGGTVAPSPAFGWAGRYRVGQAGTATLRFDGGPIVALSFLYSLAAWAAVALLVILVGPGRFSGLRWLRRRTIPVAAGHEGGPAEWDPELDGP